MTMLVTVVVSLLAVTVAMVVVHQVLLAADAARDRADRAAADRVVADVVDQFSTALAADPGFYTRELFWAERPRMCAATAVTATGDPASEPTLWPDTCPQTWTYPSPGATVPGYDPATRVARVEVHPPSATDPTLRLVVAATVGSAEQATEVTYALPGASGATVWSAHDLNLDTLVGAGTAAVSGTVYSGATVTTPTDPRHFAASPAGPVADARLVGECGVTGEGPDAGRWVATRPGDRSGAGCEPTAQDGARDARDLAPTPIGGDAAERAVTALLSRACPDTAPAPVTTADGAWATAVCLHRGASVLTVDATLVTVPADTTAYRVTFTGTASAPTVQVDVATSLTEPADPAAAAAAYTAGTHPASPVGGAWTTLGVLPAPVTGVLHADATVYVGSCPAAFGQPGCPAVTAQAPVTLVAGTPAAPARVVLAAPLAGQVTLVATGQLEVAFYARPAGADLATSGHLLALATSGPSLVTPAPGGWQGGTWRHTGALGGTTLAPLTGWDHLEITGALVRSPLAFAPSWRVVSHVTLDTMDLCQAASCATW